MPARLFRWGLKSQAKKPRVVELSFCSHWKLKLQSRVSTDIIGVVESETCTHA